MPSYFVLLYVFFAISAYLRRLGFLYQFNPKRELRESSEIDKNVNFFCERKVPRYIGLNGKHRLCIFVRESSRNRTSVKEFRSFINPD